jgi:hypothetical protein
MITSLLLQIKVFLFIMSILILIADILHTASVFVLKSGKIIPSTESLVIFGVSFSYILTMLICGF